METNKEIMTPKDISEALGVGLNFTYRQLRAGKIPSVRIGDLYFTDRETFFKFLSGQSQPAVAEKQ